MSEKKIKLAKHVIKKHVERESVEKWAELAESFRKQFMEIIKGMSFKDRLKFCFKVMTKKI